MLKLNDKKICTWERFLATAFNIVISTTLEKIVFYALVVQIPKFIAMVKLFTMLKIFKTKLLYFGESYTKKWNGTFFSARVSIGLTAPLRY